jgi:hypothetical protein
MIAGFLLTSFFARAQDGPSHVIVTYRVLPDKHGSFRASINSTVGRLSQWKDNGVIGGFALLTNALIDDEGWESTAIVQLGGRGLEQIKRLDQPDAASLSNTTTVPADLIESGIGDGENPSAGVYLVVPYESTGSPDDYKAWAKSYLVPLLNATLKEGGLMAYQLFWARFPVGRSWTALLVMHYRDWTALGQRDAVTAKIGAIGERESGLGGFEQARRLAREGRGNR